MLAIGNGFLSRIPSIIASAALLFIFFSFVSSSNYSSPRPPPPVPHLELSYQPFRRSSLAVSWIFVALVLNISRNHTSAQNEP